MGKILIFIYGLLAYAIGMGGLVYFILFVGGWSFMPQQIHALETPPLATALMINAGLILLFGLQHTIMARPGFKAAWTRIVPKAMERSTYVLLSGILMVVISLYWQGIEGTVWDAAGTTLGTALLALHIAGWIIAVIATFLINHFELFGLQQIWYNLKSQTPPKPVFTDRFLYKVVRHPLQFGILMGLWFNPTMSMTLACLALMMTIYILIGLIYEERDLAAALGESYEEYRSRVRKLIPIPK